MTQTIDLHHLPSVPEISDETESDALSRALDETMQNYNAAMNTMTRGGQPLTELAGSYLSRAGGIQLLMAKKKTGK